MLDLQMAYNKTGILPDGASRTFWKAKYFKSPMKWLEAAPSENANEYPQLESDDCGF